MPAGAIIGAVGTVAAAGIGAYTANKASKQQKKASKKAIKAQEAATRQYREDLAPYASGGKAALERINQMYGLGTEGGDAFTTKAIEDFKRSPDYQVALREGIRALDSSAASRGNLLSGGQIKAVQDRGADIASMYFGRYMTQLANLAGMGQNAAAGQGSASMTGAGRIGGYYTDLGAAAASGTVGAGNAISSGIDSLTSNAALTSYLSTPGGSSYGGYGDSSLARYYNDFA